MNPIVTDAQLQIIIGKIETLGGQGVEVASRVVQVNGLQALLTGAVFLFFALLFMGAALHGFYKDDGEGGGWQAAGVIGVVFAFFSTLFGLICVLNIWNWIALSEPKLALAHQIFERIMTVAK